MDAVQIYETLWGRVVGGEVVRVLAIQEVLVGLLGKELTADMSFCSGRIGSSGVHLLKSSPQQARN